VTKCTRREFLGMAGRAGAVGLAGGLSILNSVGCGGGGSTNMKPPDNPHDGNKELVNLVGDLHVHTSLSDGDESPDFALRYAKNVSKLDFCCITDHAESIADDHLVALPYYRSLPAKFDRPGEFCVLYGYEWTSLDYGHRSVYSTDNSMPLLPSNDSAYSDIEDLWRKLSGYNVITVPHHPMIASTRVWWDYVNPAIERLVEFYSKWGLSLREGNMRPLYNAKAEHGVIRALNAGRRYGLLCGTDSHMSRPGSLLFEERPDSLLYPRPGTVGVWATAHTREAIFDALKQRRCYGMTGTRVRLDFSVNKSIMGTEIGAVSSPLIAFHVSCGVPISRISILKTAHNATVALNTYLPNSLEFSQTYTDNEFVEDSGYSIMVDLDNTDMAMCSPVWVDKLASSPLL